MHRKGKPRASKTLRRNFIENKISAMDPGYSQEITKYHSDQYVNCWNQWRTEALGDVLSQRLMKSFSGGFLA